MGGQPVRVALGALLFAIVATLNSGGYRYGASDQAFYIPAILLRLQPNLYPRDTALVGPQARYFFVDEIAAGIIRVTGASIETVFAAGYLLTLVVFAAALFAMGRTVYASSLAVWALFAVETLRHRITKTGVNTLEGYFHPRMLVFAIGVAAIVWYLRGRPWLALTVAVLGGLLHPTTAAFFVVFLAAAIWTTEPRMRKAVGAGATAAVVGLAWLLLAGPLRGAAMPMDADWRALLAAKDYLFPASDWRLSAWIANLGTATLAILAFSYRVRRGIGSPRERGLVAGAVVLLAGFLITLPAVTAGSAFFVQLQISRVFWILDLLAVVGLVAIVVDSRTDASPARWRRVVVAALVAVAVARGLWSGFVEHAGRPVVSLSLPADDWTRVIDWASTQGVRTQFLADPGHAWKYGAPLRYAGRDVFLEDVKDTAMAIYSRESAERVLSRQRALGDFASLDEIAATRLAAAFRIDYLVIDRDLQLPLVHQEGPFRIYRLRAERRVPSP